MQGRLGLQQTPKRPPAAPAPPGACAPRRSPRPSAMGRSGAQLRWSLTTPPRRASSASTAAPSSAAARNARIRDHVTGLGSLTGCSCNTETFFDFKQKLVEEAEKASASKKQKVAEEEVVAAANAALPSVKEEKPKLGQQSIQASLKAATGVACDEAIAEFFYACNISPACRRPPALKEVRRDAQGRAGVVQGADSAPPRR